MKKVIIIGGVAAGMSAALYLARSKYSFEIVEKNMIGGKLNITTRIDNYPGVPSTDGFTLADTMKKQLESFNIKVKIDILIWSVFLIPNSSKILVSKRDLI